MLEVSHAAPKNAMTHQSIPSSTVPLLAAAADSTLSSRHAMKYLAGSYGSDAGTPVIPRYGRLWWQMVVCSLDTGEQDAVQK